MKNMETQTRLQNQKGFTLVEIAIVLVIIGLLLGGVLKGQEMINSAKIKTDTDTLVALQASAYAYKDRTGAYPGTPFSSTGAGSKIAVSSAESDGTNTSGGTFFTDLFTQDFIKSTTILGEFDSGSYYSVQNSAPIAGTDTKVRNMVCISNITDEDAGSIVQGMDVKLDDGVATTGNVRYTVTAAPVAKVCLEF